MHGNLSITRTVPHGVTTPLERHPSFPDGLPAIIAEPVEHGYCTDCASLAGQIRACERLGDWDGMTAYGWVAIRHVEVAHPAQSPRSEARAEAVQEARGPSRSHHDSTGGAR